jgi:hypothetical protein
VEYPNLFIIEAPVLPSPFSEPIIAMEGDSIGFPNLAISDIGCFKGDCYCCPEDGSGNPIASITWENGKFVYYTLYADFSFLKFTYGGIVTNAIGDISGEINVYSSASENSYFSFEGWFYTIGANNKCGGYQEDAYCLRINCYGTMAIDCETSKILVTKYFYALDGLNLTPEITKTYYNLGSVPDIYDERNNGCGPGCYIDIKPRCLYTKNSLVFNFSDFNDFIYERTTDYSEEAGLIYYESWEFTGLSSFNRTYILPLYIASCNIANNPGSIRYNNIPFLDIGPGILRTVRRVRQRNPFTGIYSDIENTVATYNIQYSLSHLSIPGYKVKSYNIISLFGSSSGTCTDTFVDSNCNNPIRLYWMYNRYEKNSDFLYSGFNYENALPPFCEEGTLIRKYVSLGEQQIGYARVYYDSL